MRGKIIIVFVLGPGSYKNDSKQCMNRGGERKFGKYVPDPVNLQPRSEYLQPRSRLPTAPIRKPTAPIRTYVPIRLLHRQNTFPQLRLSSETFGNIRLAMREKELRCRAKILFTCFYEINSRTFKTKIMGHVHKNMIYLLDLKCKQSIFTTNSFFRCFCVVSSRRGRILTEMYEDDFVVCFTCRWSKYGHFY